MTDSRESQAFAAVYARMSGGLPLNLKQLSSTMALHDIRMAQQSRLQVSQVAENPFLTTCHTLSEEESIRSDDALQTPVIWPPIVPWHQSSICGRSPHPWSADAATRRHRSKPINVEAAYNLNESIELLH
jgi:hypothetical protein